MTKKKFFDYQIGNPPYQQSDGGAGASAKPVYNIFLEEAKKLNPEYMCFVIPAKWYSGGKGLDQFREDMLTDNHISVLEDYTNSGDVFNNVDIAGGYASSFVMPTTPVNAIIRIILMVSLLRLFAI